MGMVEAAAMGEADHQHVQQPSPEAALPGAADRPSKVSMIDASPALGPGPPGMSAATEERTGLWRVDHRRLQDAEGRSWFSMSDGAVSHRDEFRYGCNDIGLY